MFFVIYHSSTVTPTRRVALGEHDMNGVILGELKSGLAFLWMQNLALLDEGQPKEVVRVLEEVLAGNIPSSRLRCRIQQDTQGLKMTRITLTPFREPELTPDVRTISPQQILLGIVLLANSFEPYLRYSILVWLLGLCHGEPAMTEDMQWWAKGVLGFSDRETPTPSIVKKRFREKVRRAHPDHNNQSSGLSVGELVKARDILLKK